MPKHIHLISFDNPYPPDYGGAIDVYYKILAFKNIGVDVTLHIYEYKRTDRSVLEKFCKKVFYYHRPRNFRFQLSRLPFIVNTRRDQELLTDLLEDDVPIFFEGLHTTYFLDHPLLKGRKKIVRTHNIEHLYYSMLADRERNLPMKVYLSIEARRLKNFETVLSKADGLVAISETDERYFRTINPRTVLASAFHPFEEIRSKLGSGKFILYHGNLEVAENIEAAEFIIQKIMPELSVPLVIAGKNPSERLLDMAKLDPNINIIANPSDTEMNQLISDAQIHLLPTFQPTGLKLKLLYALFAGRHVIVSPEMVIGSDLNQLCHICRSKEDYRIKIGELMQQPFDEKILTARKEWLANRYSNRENILRIENLLFG